jgi:hypothetical protein
MSTRKNDPRVYCSEETSQILSFGACLRNMTKREFVDVVVAELVRRHNSHALTMSVRSANPLVSEPAK